MKGKRLLVLTLAAVALAALVVPWAGCQGEISFTTASLSNATMCKSVDPQTMAPIEPTDVYSPDTLTFYCSVKLSNAPSDTEIKAEWIYVQGEAGVANQLIDTNTITAGGDRYLGFSLERGTDVWPQGDYKIVLFIGGKERQSVPFKVQ